MAPVIEQRIAEERMHALTPPGFTENTGSGRVPLRAKGKRVAVQLRNGSVITEPVNKDTPPGWAADGKGGCRWSFLDPDDPAAAFDIVAYKVL